MKHLRTQLFSLLIILTTISIIIPAKADAVDITVGATTWYAWWDVKQSGVSMDADPEFLYGPALSVKFNDDFNLTFIYLHGKYDFEIDQGGPTPEKLKIKRNDSDLALNYRLNDYFKVFAGIKYMNFKQEFNHRGIGPGLGLSATYPIADNLFLLGTLSGFYLWGKEEDTHDGDTKYKEYGFNSTLSLAYYIASASTTISLGGRFQYIKTDWSKDNMTHKIYGATLTATYSFSI